MKAKVLFVCLGNICRSPSAEAIFKNLMDEAEFVVDSAGTSGHHVGEKADTRMMQIAANRDILITSISRKFEMRDFRAFDYIIVMDDTNLKDLNALDYKHEYTQKILKMTDYCSSKYPELLEVPDPYYGGIDGFNNVLDILEDACQNLLIEIRS